MLTDHVTCQRQLRRFIAIHASSPVASVFIYTLQNLAGNLGTFSYSCISTVNSDMLLCHILFFAYCIGDYVIIDAPFTMV